MRNITTFDFTGLEKFNKIFCLVSGGIDSTYLAEIISEYYPNKTYLVNCWNPYEQSKTLRILKKNPMYIEIRPKTELDYKKILDESFSRIPKAIEDRKNKKYQKKVFPCCKHIKHNAFKKHPMFKEPNTVVISGIKRGDGQQRRLWLHGLKYCKATTKGMKVPLEPTFFYRHKEGQMYCYPFRDFKERELPKDIIKKLQLKYEGLKHSGCSICPVLVVFQDRFSEPVRTQNSIDYYNKFFTGVN